MLDESAVLATVDAMDLGKPSAAKRGRRSEWPYVPVVDHGTRTQQIKGRAYATRDEAVACATRSIEHVRRLLVRRILDPRERALREHHNLPTEI